MKKIALIIYPYFSLQEITCLTDALKIYYDQTIDIYSSSKSIVVSEDGFQIIPQYTLEEFDREQYVCVVLSGMINPFPALFDKKLIRFLSSLKNQDILIASISASPLLLGKAGLLEDIHYTSGCWYEIIEHCSFMPTSQFLPQPLVHDKNIITAIGFSFREFAIEIIRTLGIDSCEKGLFNPPKESYQPQELIHYMGEENFKEFLKEYNEYEKDKDD